MTKKLVIIGAGGHAKSCLGVIESSNEFSIHGFIDPKLAPGTDLLGYPVLGDNDLITELSKQDDVYFFIAVGQIGSPEIRVRLFEMLTGMNARIVPVIKAKSAFVSAHASVGAGSIVMHQAVVNTHAKVGNNTIVNNFALVEHDAVAGDHVHVSTGAIINGNCIIGDRVFIGSGATLVQGVNIAADVIIGAGAVVISSIAEPGTYAGNPAKKIK